MSAALGVSMGRLQFEFSRTEFERVGRADRFDRFEFLEMIHHSRHDREMSVMIWKTRPKGPVGKIREIGGRFENFEIPSREKGDLIAEVTDKSSLYSLIWDSLLHEPLSSVTRSIPLFL